MCAGGGTPRGSFTALLMNLLFVPAVSLDRIFVAAHSARRYSPASSVR